MRDLYVLNFVPIISCLMNGANLIVWICIFFFIYASFYGRGYADAVADTPKWCHLVYCQHLIDFGHLILLLINSLQDCIGCQRYLLSEHYIK